MIVRINQHDASRVEQESGWGSSGLLGPIQAPVPPGTRAFEMLILSQDEQNRPLTDAFRQSQLRHMIPQALTALREPGEEVVVRLDGPVTDGELLPAFRWLTDPDGRGRYAVNGPNGLRKLEDRPMEVLASVRLHASPPRISGMCADPALGLERSVRLRAFCVPETLVNVLLDMADTEDDRWEEVLDGTGLVLGTTRGLRSLQLMTHRLELPAIRRRIMQRLMSLAGATG